MKVLGVDPGISGAFVLTDGEVVTHWAMPTKADGKNKSVDFGGVYELLFDIQEKFGPPPVFLERAIPFALGAKSAFSYGRGFEALTVAIGLMQFPLTLVEPGKWTKEMHEGIMRDWKPKAKSLAAAKRLHPKLVGLLPLDKKGIPRDGFIDALLIASYGLRRLHGQPAKSDIGDFY